MAEALIQARMAIAHNDIPIGAVVVHENQVIGLGHNEREKRNDPTAHAEVLAIRQACETLGTSRLDGATLISTLEPCVMCAGAAVLARVERVVFGCFDPKAGALGSLYNVGVDPRLNHGFEIKAGVHQELCAELLSDFFAKRR